MILKPERFIKNGEIDISKEEWIVLNNNHSKEEVIELLHTLVESFYMPMPLRAISKEEAIEDFKNLCSLDSTKTIQDGPFYSRYPYQYKYLDKYVETSSTGNRSSDYFHQYSRFLCDSINAPSPYRTWTIRKFRTGLFNSLWTLKCKEVNFRVLRGCIGLRKYIAAQFRPSAAKALYEYFNSENVLDFSSGWGDRLAGFHAAKCTKSYIGIDPNARLMKGYKAQCEFYNTGKECKFIESPAEEVDFSIYSDKFDTIFTSPPYFIVERYTSEGNQSWKRYKKIDDWKEKFLYAVLEKITPTLKKDGYLIVNISDVYCNHTINKICDDMNRKIESLGYTYVGGMGYRMNKRPNSKAGGVGIFAEPIWIWKK